MKPLKVGIIGLGVGEQHIAGYRRSPHCEVVVLCDFSAEKRAEVASRHPDLPIVADADRLLEDPAIDVVSIASFDNYHAAQVITAFEAGKHVFVEKPICLEDGELAAIREASQKRPDLRLSSNLILRKCPRFEWLRRQIASGAMGELFHVAGDYNYGRLHKITGGWRGRLEKYSAVHGGAIHLIDLIMWITGERLVEVTARGNRIAARGSSFRNHDFVVAVGRLESGALAKVSTNFGCVRPHFHAFEVYGTRATFVNDLPEARFFTSSDPGVSPEAIDLEYPGTHKGDLIKSFVEAIVTGEEPEVPAEDVFAVMSVSLAVERASHQLRPVTVRYL